MTISQDSNALLIVVVGATGAQGGSVIKALTESNHPYRIRAFTRDPTKPVGKELSAQGIDVVVYDPQSATDEGTQKLFEGATYVFAVTVSALFTGKEAEITEGKRYINAAKAANVKLLVWSGLESTTELSHGKHTGGIHFDAKAEVTAHAKAIGVPFVNVSAATYMQTYLETLAPRKQADGSYLMATVGAPSSTLPLIDVQDYGLFVRKALETPGDQEIFAYGEVISLGQVTEQLAQYTGKQIHYVHLTLEQFTGALKAAGLTEMYTQGVLNVAQTMIEAGFWGKKDIGPSLKGLAKRPKTWNEFVKATDWSSILN